jgi:hypothetical protein
MTITPNDIKLLASLRMHDATDGGGPMSAQVLQDGLENNVFSDIGSIARAQGALQLRRVWAAVLSATNDALIDAHMIIEDAPDDPAVSCVLMPAPAGSSELSGLAAAINAAGEAHVFAGATPTTGNTAAGVASVQVARVRAPMIPKPRLSSQVSGAVSTPAAMPRQRVNVPSDSDPVEVSLPREQVSVPVVDGQLQYTITIPAGSVVGSESLVYEIGPVTYTRYVSPSGDFAPSPSVSFSALDRTQGLISVVFGVAPTGDEIIVRFVRGGITTPLPASALQAAALDATGRVTVTLAPGQMLAGATFSTVGGTTLQVLDGLVYLLGSTTVMGTASDAGVIYVPGQAGRTITNWKAAQTSTSHTVSALVATLPANLDPATLQLSGTNGPGVAVAAAADGYGTISDADMVGSYDPATGALRLTFPTPMRLASLQYSATLLAPQTAVAQLWGIDPAKLAADGTVPIVRPGQVAVLRHTLQVAAATYAAGANVNLGRTALADVRIVGGNGAGITSGWTVDLATGLVSITNVTGWAQPVVIKHAIEHVALVLDVPDPATVVLNRAPTRAFPAGSLLSTALLMGDLQAQAGGTFTQQAWTGEWSGTRIGAAINVDYQEATAPIEVTNLGAITEDWVFIFKTTTTFECFGRLTGKVGDGTTSSDFSPINPATNAPYMTVRATGWGTGWGNGNVMRTKTRGAAAGPWVARTTLPSNPGGADGVTLGIRGDIDA